MFAWLEDIVQGSRYGVPTCNPHIHRRNTAKRAIHTFKNHLITDLYACNPEFPASLWNWLLPKSNITFNLLRSLRYNLSLSTYAVIFGDFIVNNTPLVLPCTKFLVYLKPGKRNKFGAHGIDRWYIGLSTKHYRCHNCFIPETRRTRDANTVELFLHQVSFLKVTTENYLHQATTDLLAILQSPVKHISSLTYVNPISNAYIQISQNLNIAIDPPVQPPPPPTTFISSSASTNPTLAPSLDPPKPRHHHRGWNPCLNPDQI